MRSTFRTLVPRRFQVICRSVILAALGAASLPLLEGTAQADNYREVTLRFKHSGKYVDVSGISTNVGANIHQWDKTGNDNQRWVLIPAPAGYYYLRAKNSGLYLDVDLSVAGGQNDGAIVHQWSYTGATNQRFKFEVTPDGYYRLTPGHAPGKCVDVAWSSLGNGAQLQLATCNDSDSQKLTLVHDERFDRPFAFAAKHTGKCLDVAGASASAGASVHQWDCHTGANQKFRLSLTPDWYYRIIPTHSNMCLDTPDFYGSDTLKQEPCSESYRQKFKLANTDGDDYFNLDTWLTDFSPTGNCIGIQDAGQNNGNLAAASPGCATDDKKFQLQVFEGASRQSFHEQLARKYRPRLRLSEEQECNPLTFHEGGDLAGFENHCRLDFNGDFAVFANVYDESLYPGGGYGWRSNSFRISYGVAFGQQPGELQYVDAAGSHGYDAQYLVVDVVDGNLTSVWADMHKGSYSRTRDMLTMHDNTHVTAWVGESYNSLKLVDDTVSICSSDITFHSGMIYACGGSYMPIFCASSGMCPLDGALNWGDPVGDFHQKDGKLVMVEHACAADPGLPYVSADGITYDEPSLAKLRAYMGCPGAQYQWGDDTASGGKNTFRYKPIYGDPYGLEGCDSGAAADGGDICNATSFGNGQDWLTSREYRDMYIDPNVAGAADVDYTAGTPFNDINTIASVPSSIRIRTGERVDKVSITYAGGALREHGYNGGSQQEMNDLVNDPIVAVKLCGGWEDGKRQAGRIELTTRNGRFLAGGQGNVDCRYIAPQGKRFMGFYGRSGDFLDLLGTFWGNMSMN